MPPLHFGQSPELQDLEDDQALVALVLLESHAGGRPAWGVAELSGRRVILVKERSFWIGFMLLVAVALAVPPDTAALSQGVAATNSVMTSAAPAALALAALDQEAAKPSIDINITKTDRGGGEWYKNPIVVGAGVIILVLLVALASRGGGTTVVKS